MSILDSMRNHPTWNSRANQHLPQVGAMIHDGDRREARSAVDWGLDIGAAFDVIEDAYPLPDGSIPIIQGGVHSGKAAHKQLLRQMPDGTYVRLNPCVSAGYVASSYGYVLSQIDALFPESTVGMKLIEDGKRLMVIVRPNDGEGVAVHGDDRISLEIMFTASLDSSWTTAAYGIASRFWCKNQTGLENAVFSVKRTANHDANVLERSVMIAQAQDDMEAYMARARFLQSVELTTGQAWNMIHRIFPYPQGENGKDASKRALTVHQKRIQAFQYYHEIERERCGYTGWAFVQAIQSYDFHHRTKDDPVKQADVVISPYKNEKNTARALQLLGVAS